MHAFLRKYPVAWGSLLGGLLIPVIQMVTWVLVRLSTGRPGNGVQVFLLVPDRIIVQALFWGGLLGAVAARAYVEWREDRPWRARALCLRAGTVAASVILVEIFWRAFLLYRFQVVSGGPRDDFLPRTFYRLVGSTPLQLSILIVVAGSLLSRRRPGQVQVTERLRL